MTYTITDPMGELSVLVDRRELFNALQRHGIRYSELQGIIEDIDYGFPVTTDDGYTFQSNN